MAAFIEFERVWKRFQKGQAHDSLRDLVPSIARQLMRRPANGSNGKSSKNFWALRDLSFEVRSGEVLGIIGPNGAGKSTTLKILNGIMDPTSGVVRTNGKIGSLIEVSAGFHPDLTGRQNVYLQGAIMGMRKTEVGRKFDEIVAFAGVEEFLDTPVKRYSSGMNARLGFAIAAHLEPEILIIDEALAVGDAAFQNKCIRKMGDVARGGRTVLLVTHQMGYISMLADRAMLLERGRVKFVGETSRAIATYLDDATTRSSGDLRQHPEREPGMTPTIVAARLTDASGQDRDTFSAGDDWFLEIEYSNPDQTRLAGGGFNIRTREGFRVGSLNTYMCSRPPYQIPASGKLRFCIPRLPLNPGDFLVSVFVGVHPNEVSDWVGDAVAFSVIQSDFYGTGYVLHRDRGPSVFTGSCEVLSTDLAFSGRD